MVPTTTTVMTKTTVLEMPTQEIPLTVVRAPTASPSCPPQSPSPPPSNTRVFDVAQENTLRRSSQLLIVVLVIVANLVQFISMFLTLGAGFRFSELLGQEAGPGKSNWMGAGYSVTQGTFVLISGRLGAVYGHQRILLVGGAILVLFSIVNGFCKSYSAFIVVRALTGIGGGLILPNAVAIIMMMLPPGRARNISTAFFGASAPIGGWLGALFSGLFIQLSKWEYLFFFTAALAAVVFAGLAILLPKEQPVDKGGKIDIVGSFLGIGGLLVFNVSWNQAPSAGWNNPAVMACLVLSVVLFAGFLVWERRFAAEPIMPLSIFRLPTFTALVFVVLLSYMSFGISLWYMIAWQQLVRGWTVLDLTVGWIPFALGATAAVQVAAWLIPRLAVQWIMAVGVAAALAANSLLAPMPARQSYWPQTFPAIVASSVCPDFVYVAAQIIASNSVGRRHQGVAGSLIGTLNLYGNSLGLGFAGTVETEVARHKGADALAGYRAALYFGVALAVVGLVLDFAWVRMPKDEREGWDPEMEGEDDVAPVGAASGVESGAVA